MNDDIIVVGYPKSGNTWLARMLADATNKNMERKDPVNSLVNDDSKEGNGIVRKWHYFPEGVSRLHAPAVYIVRDVRDVLVSGFFHCNRHLQGKNLNENFFTKVYFPHEILRLNKAWQGNSFRLLTRGFWKNKIKKLVAGGNAQKVGGWSDHVNFWTNQSGVVVVRYEDFLSNAEENLYGLLECLNIKVTNKDVERAVNEWNFEKKKRELEEAGDKVNSIFLRRGQSGDWENYLGKFLLRRIEAEHSEVLSKMGYELKAGG